MCATKVSRRDEPKKTLAVLLRSIWCAQNTKIDCVFLVDKVHTSKNNIYSSLCTGSGNIFIFVQVVKLENASLHVVKVVSTALFPLIALLFLGQIALLALTKAVDNLGSRACCPLGIFFAVHLHPLCVGLGL